MRDVVKDIIRKRQAQKDKEDHILLDTLMDTDFIDEEEVTVQLLIYCKSNLKVIHYFTKFT
jgi:hypothetical protein